MLTVTLLTSTLEGGGAARVLAHMANHWAGQGDAVTLISFEDGSRPPFYPLHPAVRVRYLNLNRQSESLAAGIANNWNRCAAIRSAILADRPQAVISFIDSANVRTILAMLGSGVPVIVSERVHPGFENIGPIWTVLRRLTYPLASRVVVQTSQIAAHLRGWGLRRVEVIPNPVLLLPPTGAAPRLPRPCLLAVGRIYPQKDYGLMLRAFAAAKCGGWTLCIAGDGPERGAMERLAESLGLGEHVRFLGQVADVGGLLAQVDAYVLSSAYEGFPNALCEAMATGLACVATDCPSGPADLISHGENGLLVPNGDQTALADALHQVMTDRDLAARLGQAARAVRDRFGPERIMAAWEDCIRRSAGRGAGGTS